MHLPRIAMPVSILLQESRRVCSTTYSELNDWIGIHTPALLLLPPG